MLTIVIERSVNNVEATLGHISLVSSKVSKRWRQREPSRVLGPLAAQDRSIGRVPFKNEALSTC